MWLRRTQKKIQEQNQQIYGVFSEILECASKNLSIDTLLNQCTQILKKHFLVESQLYIKDFLLLSAKMPAQPNSFGVEFAQKMSNFPQALMSFLDQAIETQKHIAFLDNTQSKNVIYPLAFGKKDIGCLWIKDRHPHAAPAQINDSTIAWFYLFGNMIAQIVDATVMSENSKYLSLIDEESGVYSKRAITRQLEEEFHRFKRYHDPFITFVVEFALRSHDNGKAEEDEELFFLDDSHLKYIGKMILDNLRTTDVVGRFGNNQFLVVCPHTTIEACGFIEERFVLQMKNISLFDDVFSQLILKIGIAMPETPQQLLQDFIKQVLHNKKSYSLD